MEAVRDEKTSAMTVASTNGTVKKIFRARKTMTASCRQQIATLNKLKNPSKIETFKESPVLTKENVQRQHTKLVSPENCIAQNNTSSEMEKHQSQNPSPNEFNTFTEVLPEDSGLKTGHSLEGKWEECSKPCENLASVETLVGNPANFSHIAHNVNDATSNTKMTNFNDVRPVSSPLGVVEKEKPISGCDYLQDIDKDTLNTNMDNCSPVSEISESLSPRLVNEDCLLKMNSATGLVTQMDILDTDSTNAVIPSNESNASCGTAGASDAVMPSFTVTVHVDSAQNNLSQSCNTTSGDCQKKRSFSGDSGVSEAKRAKTSNKSLLDEIGGLIQGRIETVFKESFDQRIQDLSQQINLIQCKEDNIEILTRHLRSIKRLGRRIKSALQAQNEVVIQSSKLPSVGSNCKELPKSKAAETSTSPTEKNSMQKLTANSLNPLVLSDHETEQQSDQGQAEHQRKTSKKVDHSAIRKIMESIKEHRNKTLDKQPMAVIDLTDDEEQKADGDSTLDTTYPSSSHITSSCSAPVPEDEKNENLSQECSEKKELPEGNNNEYSYDVTEKTSSGHKSVNSHDSVAYLDISQNPDTQMLKPPQKPELRLAQVQNPKGIALSWNITHADPSCAAAQVYCLYVHQENTNHSKKLWKKIGEIKALPLPMACTLTQFIDDATYSFVLRAKDACGRFGPLCDIQSTTLKSLNTTKKNILLNF